MTVEEIFETTSKIEGWLSFEVAELLIKLARKSQVIVEVGSWKGRSAITMALANPEAKIFCIDPFEGSQEHIHLHGGTVNTFSEFQKNCQEFGVQKNIEPLKMTSHRAKDLIAEVDLIFIDGSHQYPDVKADFENLFPKLKVGGAIAFHDSKWSGVKKVLWEEFIPSKNISSVHRIEDTTFARKVLHTSKDQLHYNLKLLEREKRRQRIKNLKRRLKKLGARLDRHQDLE